MGEEFISKVIFHACADHMTDICDEVVTSEFDSEKTQHQDGQKKDRFLGTGKAGFQNGSGDVSGDERDDQ